MESLNFLLHVLIFLFVFLIAVLCYDTIIQIYHSVKTSENVEATANFKLANGDSNQYNHISVLFDGIRKTIKEKRQQLFYLNQVFQFFLCTFGVFLFIFVLIIINKPSDFRQNNSLLFSFILLVLTILTFLFLFINKSVKNKINNCDNALIICSYQKTALLTAIQLNEKEMILKILDKLSEIDQDFLDIKKPTFD